MSFAEKQQLLAYQYKSKIKYFALVCLAVAVPLIAILVYVHYIVIPCMPTGFSPTPITYDSVERGKVYSYTFHITNYHSRTMSACDVTVKAPSGFSLSDPPLDESKLIVRYHDLGKHSVLVAITSNDKSFYADANTLISWGFFSPDLDIEAGQTEELEFKFNIPENYDVGTYEIKFYVNGAPLEIIKLEVI